MSSRRCRMWYVTISEKLTAKSRKNVWSSVSTCSTKLKGPLPHNHREHGNQTYPLISHTETSVCQSTAFQNGRFVLSILRIKLVSSYEASATSHPHCSHSPLQELNHLNIHPTICTYLTNGCIVFLTWSYQSVSS